MTGHFFIKKFRQQGKLKNSLPLFVSKRTERSNKSKEAFQVRYAGINKTFPNVDDSLVFVEKVLNNQLEVVKGSDIIVSSVCDNKSQEIRVTLKGIDRDEDYYFFEKYKRGTDLHFQQKTFEMSCCVIWKLYFMRFNIEYRYTLLRKNWIGNRQTKKDSTHCPNKHLLKSPAHVCENIRS